MRCLSAIDVRDTMSTTGATGGQIFLGKVKTGNGAENARSRCQRGIQERKRKRSGEANVRRTRGGVSSVTVIQWQYFRRVPSGFRIAWVPRCRHPRGGTCLFSAGDKSNQRVHAAVSRSNCDTFYAPVPVGSLLRIFHRSRGMYELLITTNIRQSHVPRNISGRVCSPTNHNATNNDANGSKTSEHSRIPRGCGVQYRKSVTGSFSYLV